MSSTYDATANPTTTTDARTALDELMAWVGVDGLGAPSNWSAGRGVKSGHTRGSGFGAMARPVPLTH